MRKALAMEAFVFAAAISVHVQNDPGFRLVVPESQ
jgi:hypothetical protein